VADVRIEPGETAKAKSVLLQILPARTQLQVELFAPSRAAGFLGPAAEVRLRYGGAQAERWLAATCDDIGVRSSIDLYGMSV
jgi:hypothetical protein